MNDGQWIELSPIETATDDGLGEATNEPPLPMPPPSATPLEALERALLGALQRPPCLVMFSGGRDSSLLLAVALRLAGAEGLPLPIPITHVHPAYPETEEDDWQRLVLAHLGLDNQIRQVLRDEFNLLGPTMRDSVRRHGIMTPAGGHLLIPTLEEARGGSLVTGIDGDALFNGGGFGPPRASLAQRRPGRRLPLSIARAYAPRPAREFVARRRDVSPPEWLTPLATEQYVVMRARERAADKFLWSRYVHWLPRRRRLVAIRQTVASLAAAYDVNAVHPFLDPSFLAVMAREGGMFGWGDRTRTLQTLFGSLLPPAVMSRTTKAVFTRPYFAADVKEFARSWDGSGLPVTLVQPDVLREIWLRERPDARTGTLLHAAWAATLPLDKRPNFVHCRLE
jgi:hypothetical protein